MSQLQQKEEPTKEWVDREEMAKSQRFGEKEEEDQRLTEKRAAAAQILERIGQEVEGRPRRG